MKNLFAKWIPGFPTNNNKNTRVLTSKEFLVLLKRNRNDISLRLVTVAVTCIHHSTPETTGQSKQLLSQSESVPKKA